MKNYVLLLFLLVCWSCSTSKNNSTAKNQADLIEIENFQKNLTDEWNDAETTPLKADEKANFKGIQFFPIDLNYRVLAEFIPLKNGRTLSFPTSANKTKYYKEYGKVKFQLNHQNFELMVYQADPPLKNYETSLFLPFMDLSNGDSSYGGGRYIDLEISDIENGKVIVDFNQAYNPYCAYSKYYNCPIPPTNNFLDTEVKAGVSYQK